MARDRQPRERQPPGAEDRREGGRHLQQVPAPAVRQGVLRPLAGEAHEPLPGAGAQGTVALFATCLADYNFPVVAANAVRVLEKNGCSGACGRTQTCCGMPNLDGGDVDAAQREGPAERGLARSWRCARAARWSSPQPTCAYVIKKEWPELLGTPEAQEVAAATFDVMELLDQLRQGEDARRASSRGVSARSRTTRPATSARRRSASPARASSASSPTPRWRSSSSARPSTARGG